MKIFTARPAGPAREPAKSTQNPDIKQSMATCLGRLCRFFAAVSRGMRLIRAYNDLRRLNTSTLRDLGDRRDELDRVLQGHLPRSYYRAPKQPVPSERKTR